MVAMSEKWIFALILLQLSWSGPGSCGKVLVWPVDHSHWINLKFILNELSSRGHNVTILVPSVTFLIDPTEPSALNYVVYSTTFQEDVWFNNFESFIYLVSSEIPKLSTWQGMAKLNEIFSRVGKMFRESCRSVAFNQEVRKKLQEAEFDVLITDPAIPCGELIAEMLEIPLVHTLRFSPGNRLEKYCGGLPTPLSYVPVAMSGLMDRMSFVERLKNTLLSLYFDFWLDQLGEKEWDQLYTEVLGKPTTLCETMGKAEMWLIRTYWDFEFPRPYLPNFEFVGGLHCQPAKPLPEEMEAFVQSSGEHGIVVFSLGSMVKNLTEEKANLIAAALAQIPQKVLWRYKGKQPATLGPNTKLYDWIPQNDLLGHPKTKAFITHGGTNGIYEAIYHGVPMVGIPMFADQPDNIAHMKAKGAAVEVDFSRMTTNDLLGALNTVINEASYKESALRLSQIHHDQPMKPLDRAVFWIEFVMRHKGAKHLRPASHSLTWYQYHCLDVVAFLLACAALGLFIIAKCCLFCCRKLGRTEKKRKRE
ncbi:UDP-glucuronosyltransferase 2B31-like isoform X1 [Tachyglossus aculeatus]|uniref:UDP-glucuronosyltransferase 2B31-like isoform X1 n=2 Tax=Tachyglossus aculeatus TaxID=9261 RepID=UPI0018F620C9|nr:UDP-glucuronosyltransferase 2B31-like isoform X1 [Tachyglossus aculeatus]